MITIRNWWEELHPAARIIIRIVIYLAVLCVAGEIAGWAGRTLARAFRPL